MAVVLGRAQRVQQRRRRARPGASAGARAPVPARRPSRSRSRRPRVSRVGVVAAAARSRRRRSARCDARGDGAAGRRAARGTAAARARPRLLLPGARRPRPSRRLPMPGTSRRRAAGVAVDRRRGPPAPWRSSSQCGAARADVLDRLRSRAARRRTTGPRREPRSTWNWRPCRHASRHVAADLDVSPSCTWRERPVSDLLAIVADRGEHGEAAVSARQRTATISAVEGGGFRDTRQGTLETDRPEEEVAHGSMDRAKKWPRGTAGGQGRTLKGAAEAVADQAGEQARRGSGPQLHELSRRRCSSAPAPRRRAWRCLPSRAPARLFQAVQAVDRGLPPCAGAERAADRVVASCRAGAPGRST